MCQFAKLFLGKFNLLSSLNFIIKAEILILNVEIIRITNSIVEQNDYIITFNVAVACIW